MKDRPVLIFTPIYAIAVLQVPSCVLTVVGSFLPVTFFARISNVWKKIGDMYQDSEAFCKFTHPYPLQSCASKGKLFQQKTSRRRDGAAERAIERADGGQIDAGDPRGPPTNYTDRKGLSTVGAAEQAAVYSHRSRNGEYIPRPLRRAVSDIYRVYCCIRVSPSTSSSLDYY